MRNRSTSAVLAFALLAMLAFTVAASGASSSSGSTGLYIVQMRLEPVVAYEGGVAGIPATKPGKGKKVDRNAEAVKRYVGHLKASHDRTLAAVGAASAKIYDYVYAYNGVAAELTDAQVAALKKSNDVVAVVENEMVSIDTSSTPRFLGLEAENGIWDKLHGPKGTARREAPGRTSSSA